MARYIEELLANFLNRYDDHEELYETLSSLLLPDAVWHWDHVDVKGRDAIMEELETMSLHLTEFRAKPVAVLNADYPEYGLEPQNRYFAVALSSMLEEYISWCCFIKLTSEGRIEEITSVLDGDYICHFLAYRSKPSGKIITESSISEE